MTGKHTHNTDYTNGYCDDQFYHLVIATMQKNCLDKQRVRELYEEAYRFKENNGDEAALSFVLMELKRLLR